MFLLCRQRKWHTCSSRAFSRLKLLSLEHLTKNLNWTLYFFLFFPCWLQESWWPIWATLIARWSPTVNIELHNETLCEWLNWNYWITDCITMGTTGADWPAVTLYWRRPRWMCTCCRSLSLSLTLSRSPALGVKLINRCACSTTTSADAASCQPLEDITICLVSFWTRVNCWHFHLIYVGISRSQSR